MTGVRPIITAVTTMVLGGGLSVALNALKTVPVAGSGGTSHARSSVARPTLIPQLRGVQI